MRSYSSWGSLNSGSLRNQGSLLKDILYIALFVIATFLAGKIKVKIGDVPITFQTLVVLLSGLILGPIKGVFSQIIYLIWQGFPLLAIGKGNSYVFSPIFEYGVGFILASFISGVVGQAYKRKNGLLLLFLGLLVADLSIYISVLLWPAELKHFGFFRMRFLPILVRDFLEILILVGVLWLVSI